jgi:cytochrome c peroxidase
MLCLIAVTAVVPADGPAEPVDAASPATPWVWDLPPGFPPPVVSAENPMTEEKVGLGRYLFYDTRLSAEGGYACASCHRQELAFTDGRARAVGPTGEVHPRSSMSLANVAYNASLTWADPDMRRLERQALVPMLNENPIEMGLAGSEERVLRRLRRDARYRRLFAAAFPGQSDPVSLENVARALASFERTLISASSPYDRLVYRGETEALTAAACRGMRLFFSEELGCSGCHGGFTFSGPVTFEGAERVEPVFHNTGLYGAYPAGDRGLVEVTGRPEDRGGFRAPTLRNVALTAPYMHDGSVATLDEVLRIYARGGRDLGAGDDGRAHPHKSDRVSGFSLDAAARAALIAFLESLTDEDFVNDPRFATPFTEGEVEGRETLTGSRASGR